MQTVTTKIPSLKDEETAAHLKTAIGAIAGVRQTEVDVPSRTLTVAFDETATTLSAIQYALALSNHPHASFAGGSKRRGWL